MNNIFVAFSIVGAAAAAPAMAVAAPYTVRGSVLDAMTAETLPGASCAFYAANDTVKPLLTLMTGADGSFTADLPRPGEYLMKVTLVSQKPVSRSLSSPTRIPPSTSAPSPCSPRARLSRRW